MENFWQRLGLENQIYIVGRSAGTLAAPLRKQRIMTAIVNLLVAEKAKIDAAIAALGGSVQKRRAGRQRMKARWAAKRKAAAKSAGKKSAKKAA